MSTLFQVNIGFGRMNLQGAFPGAAPSASARLARQSAASRPAAKPHFTIAPVYYHNYMLGDLFAAQVRHVAADMAGHRGPAAKLSVNRRKQFATLLKERVFRPGNSKPWPEFVKDIAGEELTPKYFAAEVQ